MVMLDEDDEGLLEGEGREPDANDPSHPDYDLSEAGYAGVEPEKSPWLMPRALIVVVTALILAGLLAPVCREFF